MKKLEMIVEKCGDCPFAYFSIGYQFNHKCSKTNEQIDIHKGIGEKCPLPDHCMPSKHIEPPENVEV